MYREEIESVKTFKDRLYEHKVYRDFIMSKDGSSTIFTLDANNLLQDVENNIMSFYGNEFKDMILAGYAINGHKVKFIRGRRYPVSFKDIQNVDSKIILEKPYLPYVGASYVMELVHTLLYEELFSRTLFKRIVSKPLEGEVYVMEHILKPDREIYPPVYELRDYFYQKAKELTEIILSSIHSKLTTDCLIYVDDDKEFLDIRYVSSYWEFVGQTLDKRF